MTKSSKSKKQQLIELLDNSKGAKLSALASKLNWQHHTVRSAISTLRKSGFTIATSKSKQSGEPIYRIVEASTKIGEA